VYAASFIEIMILNKENFMSRYDKELQIPVLNTLLLEMKKLLTDPIGKLFYKNLVLEACNKLAGFHGNIDLSVDHNYKIEINNLIKNYEKFLIKI
jgi:hypothetical protein